MSMLLAVAALVVLVIALLTGATLPAMAVVVLAGAGIVLLVRDWRSGAVDPVAAPASDEQVQADDLSPDISERPGGPSSDARADQR